MLENLPISMSKILPMAFTAVSLTGCHAGNAVEASTTPNPVVAPAGTVLRVRLKQTLETGRSRPGDRFSGVLDTPVICGASEVLSKGTVVDGRLVVVKDGRPHEGAVLAMTLDDIENEGRRVAVSTNVVTRMGAAEASGPHLAVAADSIVGFTLAEDFSFARL
jgi:hypothetical protein